MDKSKQKVDREKFKKGCISIFKCWTAFRMALDENPQILKYITENNTIEINDFLEILYDDIINTIATNKSDINELTDKVADCLNYFIGDYFQIQLDDDSDLSVGKDLIKLYDDLKYGKGQMLNELEAKANKDANIAKYSIEFPITGKQVVPVKKKEESDDDDEEDEEEEDEKEEDKKEDNKEEKKDDKKEDIKDDDKMKIDEPDEEGFILVKKGKKGF